MAIVRWGDDRGGTAAEYALIGALVAAVVTAAVGLVGLRTLDLFGRLHWP